MAKNGNFVSAHLSTAVAKEERLHIEGRSEELETIHVVVHRDEKKTVDAPTAKVPNPTDNPWSVELPAAKPPFGKDETIFVVGFARSHDGSFAWANSITIE